MPFLRVIRDKRGYETTYLMDWYREGHRQRSRILYVFRTPGGVRVGRDPLESDVLRAIERQYPDVAFDWKSVFDNRQVVEPTPEFRRRKRRRDDEPAEPAPAATRAPRVEAEPESPARPAVPATIEGATPDEQMAFLATWYPAVRERILRRMADPVRRDALLALAERLNPSAWTDADQITAGLPQAAEALERLARVFSKRRRRSRRRPPRNEASPPAPSPSEPSSPDE